MPGLLFTLSSQDSWTDLIEIYGPTGLRGFLHSAIGLCHETLRFKFVVYELVPLPVQYPEEWNDWPDVPALPSDLLFPNEIKGHQITSQKNVWHL